MDSLLLLAAQHAEHQGLFAALLIARPEQRPRLVERLVDVLTLHRELEVRHFYPLLLELGLALYVEKARTLHADIEHLMAALHTLSGDDSLFEPTVRVLSEYLAHHASEDEALYPRLRSQLPQAVLALAGLRMLRTMTGGYSAGVSASERSPVRG